MAFTAKSKFLPRFPSTVLATAPLTVDKFGGTYTFAYNPSVLTTTGIPSATAKLVVRDGTSYYETLANNVGNVATGVTAGSYSNMNATVDVYGRITAATNGEVPIIYSTDIASIGEEDQTLIFKGVLVFTSADSKVWAYSGAGSKVLESSYLLICDKTPEWTAVQNKPPLIVADGSVAMTGALNAGSQKITNLANGTASTDAVNKGQLDAMLPKAGGTMTGAVNMGGQSITNLATPVNASDAVTKAYVDTSATRSYILSADYLTQTGSGVVSQAEIDALEAALITGKKALRVNASHTLSTAFFQFNNFDLIVEFSRRDGGKFIKNTDSANPIFECIGGGSVKSIDGNFEYTAATTTASNRITPFIFNGVEQPYFTNNTVVGKFYHPVWVNNYSQGVVEENDFASFVNRGVYYTRDSAGISDCLTIRSNKISGFAADGVTHQGSYGISGNAFGISGASIRNVYIRDNNVKGCLGDGIVTGDITENFTISGNTIEDMNTAANGNGILINFSGSASRDVDVGTVIGNIIRKCKIGIKTDYGTNVRIIGNQIFDSVTTGAYAMLISGTSNMSIIANTVAGWQTSSTGIYAQAVGGVNPTDIYLSDNHIQFNAATSTVGIQSTSDSVRFYSNSAIIRNATTPTSILGTGSGSVNTTTL